MSLSDCDCKKNSTLQKKSDEIRTCYVTPSFDDKCLKNDIPLSMMRDASGNVVNVCQRIQIQRMPSPHPHPSNTAYEWLKHCPNHHMFSVPI